MGGICCQKKWCSHSREGKPVTCELEGTFQNLGNSWLWHLPHHALHLASLQLSAGWSIVAIHSPLFAVIWFYISSNLRTGINKVRTWDRGRELSSQAGVICLAGCSPKVVRHPWLCKKWTKKKFLIPCVCLSFLQSSKATCLFGLKT